MSVQRCPCAGCGAPATGVSRWRSGLCPRHAREFDAWIAAQQAKVGEQLALLEVAA